MKKHLKILLILLSIPICICVIIIIVSLSITLYLELTELPPGTTPYDKVLNSEDIVIGKGDMNIQEVYHVVEGYANEWVEVKGLIRANIRYNSTDQHKRCIFYFEIPPGEDMIGELIVRCEYNARQWIFFYAETTHSKLGITTNINIEEASEILEKGYLWIENNKENDENDFDLTAAKDRVHITFLIDTGIEHFTSRNLLLNIERDINNNVIQLSPYEEEENTEE